MRAGRSLSEDRRRRAGMTLVEVVVVLTIVAVTAGVLVLSVGVGGRQVGVQTEANRLAERLRLASDDVLVSRRPVTLTFDQRGYEFTAAEGAPDALRGRHELPREMKLGWRGVVSPVSIDPDTAGALNEWAILRPGETWVVAFDGVNAEVAPYREGAS